MKKNLITSVLMTIATTVLLGIIYPLVVTGLAQLFFKDKANGQLIVQNGKVIGSRIIGQAFVGSGYFHSRPSAAGNGYDAANSNGSQLGPTNQHLIDRVKADVATNQADNPGQPVPVDLVTTSAPDSIPTFLPLPLSFRFRESQSNVEFLKISQATRCGAHSVTPIRPARGTASQRAGTESRSRCQVPEEIVK